MKPWKYKSLNNLRSWLRRRKLARDQEWRGVDRKWLERAESYLEGVESEEFDEHDKFMLEQAGDAQDVS